MADRLDDLLRLLDTDVQEIVRLVGEEKRRRAERKQPGRPTLWTDERFAELLYCVETIKALGMVEPTPGRLIVSDELACRWLVEHRPSEWGTPESTTPSKHVKTLAKRLSELRNSRKPGLMSGTR